MTNIASGSRLQDDLILNELCSPLKIPKSSPIISNSYPSDPNSKISSHLYLELVRKCSSPSKKSVNLPENSVSSFSFLSQENEMGESVATGSLQDWNTQTDTSCPSSGFINDDQNFPYCAVSNFGSSLDDHLDQTCDGALNRLDEKEKESKLMEIFPALKAFDIIHALRKCEGNIDLAVDELMTQSFLEETGDRYRSVDGFASNDLSPHRKKRKQKKGKKDLCYQSSSSMHLPAVDNYWDVSCQRIQFLAERLKIPKSEIATLYNESGGSLASSISLAIQKHNDIGLYVQDDRTTHANALKLHGDFPSVSMDQLKSICQITDQNLIHAHDLLEILKPSSKSKSMTGNSLAIRSMPLNHSRKIVPSSICETESVLLPSSSVSDPQIIAKNISNLLEARNNAFSKATAAYRRGKSDHLMGAVATYYAEEGHNYNAKMKTAQSNAVDLLVATQTSKSQVDLHGLSVKDAVRIAREKVTTWWHELKEAQLRHLRCQYRIITGTGIHSKGGNSRIKPAVANMLLREGWKIEVETGGIVVTGVVNRR